MNLSPPTHGIHEFLPSAARKCRFKGMTAQETANYLASFTYRRTVPQSEIISAVNLVFTTDTITTTTTTTAAPKPQKPSWMKSATDKIFAEWKTTEQDLIDMSDVHPKDIDQRALIECLFPQKDALVCICRKVTYNPHNKTAPLVEHHNLDQAQYIVPCYMKARTGITEDGNVSCRAKSIVGERRFIVLDFDEPPSEHHASIIRWLMGVRAPVMVIKTGGKGLHGWYRTETQDRDAQFWRLAIMAGADKRLQANHAQAVRLPMGTRDTGAVQSVLYFNPNNLPV